MTELHTIMGRCYQDIAEFYGYRIAERSMVPLINHIDEGLRILFRLNASVWAMRAYCLHPIFQDDAQLSIISKDNMKLAHYGPVPVLLAMEYRNIANKYLSTTYKLYKEITISPLEEVNDMLRADKIQNRKDFEIYHKATHERSAELDTYFKEWLKVLKISEEDYKNLTTNIDVPIRVHDTWPNPPGA